MLNKVMQVGILRNISEKREFSNGKCTCTLILEIPRPFKNSDGENESDIVKVTLWNDVCRHTCTNIEINSIVGVQERISCKSEESSLEIVADKISYLAQAKPNKEEA